MMTAETVDPVALQITSHTLVGVYTAGGFPVAHGNCFNVLCSDGKERAIVNVALENLEEAIKRGVTWPIKIKRLSDRHAVIHDERIPDNWYGSGFCEICCPKELLPVDQLLAHERQIARGEREEHLGCVCIDWSKRPKL